MERTFPALLLTWLIAFPISSVGQVYRWKDEHGKVHYGDRPIDQQAEAVRLPPPPTGLQAAPGHSDGWLQRYLQARQEERDARRQVTKERIMDARKRDETCRRATNDLQLLRNQPRLMIVDAHGNERLLTDEERQRQTSLVVDEIERSCDEPLSRRESGE